MYARLFDWLLGPINEALFVSSSNVTIGILDIFGFEVFEENLFEQLTINYANEKLQQHFIGHIFKQEQQVRVRCPRIRSSITVSGVGVADS